jgi:hypothetical protein
MVDAATFVASAVPNTLEMLDARVIKATMMATTTATVGSAGDISAATLLFSASDMGFHS